MELLLHNILINVIILLSLPSLPSAATLSNETDRLSLMAIKEEITSDPLGMLNSWNDSLHFCLWEGVSCGQKHRQRVVALNLISYKLTGKLSPYVGNLSFLANLDLSRNNFQDRLPSEISQLSRLRALIIPNNSFWGRIPTNLSSLSNLRTLDMFQNDFTGSIPSEFGHLAKLTGLYVSYNNFFRTTIPPSLGNLSSLVSLYLDSNDLVGRIPSELARLHMLQVLSLEANELDGSIPSQIYNLSNLRMFSLNNNKLHGSLPWDIGLTLPRLEWLGFASNNISGLIPVSLLNCSNLATLVGTDNQLSGPVPRDLGRLQNLFRVYLDSNRLGSRDGDDFYFLNSLTNCTNLTSILFQTNLLRGSLPNSIGNLSSQLVNLQLGENQIHGRIPLGISNLVNLQALNLAYSNIEGSIPNDLGKLWRLQRLYLKATDLTGEIPSSISNLTWLNLLYLDHTSIDGHIPPALGKCQNLLVADISSCNLTGPIPSQIFQQTSRLNTLVLADNSLTGPLPEQVGNLKHLVSLDVSSNKLLGRLPSTLGECVSLVQLRMQHNLFQGTIPQSLSSLRSIEELDVSYNNLSGNIPQFLQNFTFLKRLNFSFNDFNGTIPMSGIFTNASVISVEGNNKLCGGISELQLPRCHDPSSVKNKKPSIVLKVVLPVVAGIILLALLTIFLIMRRKRKLLRGKLSSVTTPGHPLLMISYGELLEATNNFSEENLIGAGSFGSVYKGVMIIDHEETTVAVKVLNLQQRGGPKSFLSECNALRNIRHRNLVRVLTSCSTTDFQCNDFKALVFEFMPNGSLERWLYPEVLEEQSKSRNVSFVERLNIAIDVAQALVYLHLDCESTIVHSDLKPSNILLDNEMTAHVSDFGIAKVLSSISDNSEQSGTSSFAIKGSIGYVPPEYGVGADVSTQGDVYSYGILLLEMFTGKRPTSDMFKDGLSLHTYVKGALPGNLSDIIDPQLMMEEDVDVGFQECLVSVMRVGVVCCMESPRARMHIKDVLKELILIREIYQ